MALCLMTRIWPSDLTSCTTPCAEKVCAFVAFGFKSDKPTGSAETTANGISTVKKTMEKGERPFRGWKEDGSFMRGKSVGPKIAQPIWTRASASVSLPACLRPALDQMRSSIFGGRNNDI